MAEIHVKVDVDQHNTDIKRMYERILELIDNAELYSQELYDLEGIYNILEDIWFQAL